MDNAKTKKAWSIYNETGIFVAICIVAFLFLSQTWCRAVSCKYDIGCQFTTTLDSCALGPLAHSLQHTCLVSAFHGHVHRRLCQISHSQLKSKD
ncbi:hypothetical protein CY34DRAFT_87172 [Suillus luteus UH-Slu-Lm8-n1]|uniref:Uncharacterized protein n=1 Tax=Suillus luteus UH-Slu-Lm8-n1 TaxID=930992 RepID=A0A0D0AFN4_9AGAM|nr:hypothetical protein CY34DRAFT_87172 [Suillus luteus UH-Slu-Lm8-n1]